MLDRGPDVIGMVKAGRGRTDAKKLWKYYAIPVGTSNDQARGINPNIDFALSSGYYDQSHLYGEFRKYANMTPTELLPKQDILENHVPL